MITLLLIATLFLSGCTTDSLSEYQKAVEVTEAIDQGTMVVDVKVDVDFLTDGLSNEKVRELSYYDVIELYTKTQFDHSKETLEVISSSYYNLGGIGLDSEFYVNGDSMYLKMPIIDGYFKLDKELTSGERNYQDIYETVIKPIANKWTEVLKQEDVFKGQRTYIMTEQGQIKTTTYTIEANEEQLKILYDEVMKLAEEKNIIEKLLIEKGTANAKGNQDMKKEKVIEVIHNFMNRLILDHFNGTAYVDFDNRLVKQEFEFEIRLKDAKAGEPEKISGAFKIEYLNLGVDLEFNFPDVKEDEWIDMNDNMNFKDMFPQEILGN